MGGVTGAIATGTIKGALLGALEGIAFNQVGGLLQATQATGSILASPTLDTFVAHGLVGGIFSAANGGNFGSGFLAAGVGSLADNSALSSNNIAVNVVEHAVLGGAASVLGGGKFANGAVTGAFSYAAGASYANDNHAPLNQFAGPGALAPAAPGFGEVLIDGLEGIGSAIGSGLNALATGLSLVLSGDTPQYQYYRHYGYTSDAAYFAGGLRPGSFATTADGPPMTGVQAQQNLALPHDLPPNAYYNVTISPYANVPVIGPTVVQPEYGQPGGGVQYQFPAGTPPGSVKGPFPIPHG